MAQMHPVTPVLSIVIPVFNGEGAIEELVDRLSAINIDGGLEIILVNDGSADASGAVCRRLIASARVPITLIEHARNFGEHNAVMSGLRCARGSFIVTMDDDLQNPPEAAVILWECARDGNLDVVYARHVKKQHERWRNAGSYFANAVADTLLPKPKGMYLSTFRCLSSFVAAEVTKYTGPFPYVDGLLAQATSRISWLEVEHLPRAKGKSNYTFSRLITLWLSMATGFSLKPLRLIGVAGIAMMIFGFLSLLVAIAFATLQNTVHSAMAGMMSVVLLVGGTQSILLGILGEYVGRTLLSSGGMPQAVVRSVETSRFETLP